MTKPLLASSVRGVIRNITRNKGVPAGALYLDGIPLLLDGGYLVLTGS